MKALRYLLIIMSLVSVLNVSAQMPNQSEWGKQPVVQMRSTSAMAYSGSTLPQAAATGIYVTGSTVGAYSPARLPNRPVRRDPGDDDWEDDELTGEQTENPWKNPIGDAVWPLLALASVYALLRVYRRKRSV